jgi:hypothetical protein
VPQAVLGDNARALVLDRDPGTGHVRFNPAYLQFCRDWGSATAQAYRARRRQGRVGVKYASETGWRSSLRELLAREASVGLVCTRNYLYKTTHERPRSASKRRSGLRDRPNPRLVSRDRRLSRQSAVIHSRRRHHPQACRTAGAGPGGGWFVNSVSIFHGTALVAAHRRAVEPHISVIDRSHFEGLWRRPTASAISDPSALKALGRSLADYAALVGDVR